MQNPQSITPRNVDRMKVDKIANSSNDEFYTPSYAVEPILKYVSKDKVVRCPFDTEQSHFVKMFKARGNKVICSHLSEGKDFFKWEPKEPYDVIISNPPFSCKGDILKCLYELNKPFAMLLGIVGLFESKTRFELFRDNPWEMLILNKRISFFKDYQDQKPSLNPPFSSYYITSNLLPDKICYAEINK